MNTTYHYVVLRLATDDLRGEVINVGLVLFNGSERAQVYVLATLNKLRALDATWDSFRLGQWTENVRALAEQPLPPAAIINNLAAFGYCDGEAVGMFIAENKTQLADNLAEIKVTYIANRAAADRPKREKRTRLQTALREHFRKMHVLGETTDDLSQHLVVSNVPVPAYPELKSDFVYKNGVYRVTQTIDYHVSPDSLHNKLAEACVKSTAAELALKSYGPDTKRFAVLDIPEEFVDSADAHIDLLLAQGFEIFHFNDPVSLDKYLKQAAPLDPVQ